MTNELRWKQRFENFQKAFAVFERRVNAYQLHSADEANQLSLIQAFEFTFELSWKTMKDYLQYAGYEGILGPKQVIRQAFQDKVIQNGKTWLIALEIRNESTHIYDALVLKKVLTFADKKFLTLLHQFNEQFKTL